MLSSCYKDIIHFKNHMCTYTYSRNKTLEATLANLKFVKQILYI